MANLSNEQMADLVQHAQEWNSINSHPYMGQATVFFIIAIILALITIALFYIAYKKNWSYWWIKMIKIILIIATIILLGFGWFSYNIVYI